MLRAAYLDLDGTLLGRGASLLHDADGAFTLLGVRALEACARADVEVVPYERRLRVYQPWRPGREVSLLYLGDDISAEEADELLIEEGFGFLRLVDNGLMHGVPGDGRAYHLIPRSASKARAVARHMQARGYAAEDCIAVGDSREDLGATAVVETFWLVANATPEVRDAARAMANVRVAEASHGAGVYEAVITTLAEGR